MGRKVFKPDFMEVGNDHWTANLSDDQLTEVSQEEWDEKHTDYKLQFSNGVKAMMMLDENGITCLAYVKIVSGK